MKILISGALGHMGREVARQALLADVNIAGGVDVVQGEADFPLYSDFTRAPKADVVIDFSRPDSLDALLAWCLNNHTPVVLATTGYTEAQLRQIDEAAKQIPVFRSGNMSLGIALLRALAKKAALVLGDDYDVEIVEAHHNRKLDAPSGTALMLLETIQSAYHTPHPAVHGRSGRDSKRQKGEIGVHALRGGTVTGEHEVCFFGPSERIKVSHSAENRSVFAVGALRAAAFLTDQQPGLYTMDDVVGQL